METLQRLNPALRPMVWDGRKHVPKGYRLRLPADAGHAHADIHRRLLAFVEQLRLEIDLAVGD